jgi:hypothetical protein
MLLLWTHGAGRMDGGGHRSEQLPGKPYLCFNWQPLYRALLQELTFTQGNASWGLAFRRGAFRITADDFKRIAKAMSIKSEDLSSTFPE